MDSGIKGGRQTPPAALPGAPVPACATTLIGLATGGGGRVTAAPDPYRGRQSASHPAQQAVHRVEPGERLMGPAHHYVGDPSRYCDLAAWSGIGAPYLLRLGPEVVVPAQGEPPAVAPEERWRQQDAGGGDAATGQLRSTGEGERASAPPTYRDTLPDRLVGDTPARGSRSGSHPLLRVLAEIGRRIRELWPF